MLQEAAFLDWVSLSNRTMIASPPWRRTSICIFAFWWVYTSPRSLPPLTCSTTDNPGLCTVFPLQFPATSLISVSQPKGAVDFEPPPQNWTDENGTHLSRVRRQHETAPAAKDSVPLIPPFGGARSRLATPNRNPANIRMASVYKQQCLREIDRTILHSW